LIRLIFSSRFDQSKSSFNNIVEIFKSYAFKLFLSPFEKQYFSLFSAKDLCADQGRCSIHLPLPFDHLQCAMAHTPTDPHLDSHGHMILELCQKSKEYLGA